MKTIATLTVLASSSLLFGTDANAQCSRTRPVYRPIVAYNTPVVTRHIVTRPVVTYGGFSHLDDLSIELEQLARDILWEMHFNYQRNYGYDATYAETYQILQQAKYIHQNEHFGNRTEMARVAVELDQLFHHVEDDVRNWRPSHSHFVGNGSLFDKLGSMEQTLHHLMQDVGATASTTEPPAPNVTNDPPSPALSALSNLRNR